MPFERPETIIGLDAPGPVNDPGLEVTVYPVIAEPPVAPAVNGTEIDAFPPVGDPTVGAAGTVVAVTPVDAELAVELPLAFVAVIV